MKYVRTKNKVLETNGLLIERFSNEFVKMTYEQIGLPNQHIEEIEVVKEANTIEELCDEFVIVLGNGLHRFVRRLSGQGKGGITWYRQRNYKIVNIYGAIWTNKGLIYVAKMNERGELELL